MLGYGQMKKVWYNRSICRTRRISKPYKIIIREPSLIVVCKLVQIKKPKAVIMVPTLIYRVYYSGQSLYSFLFSKF